MEYATTAWNPQTTGKIKALESVQKKAARFVTRTYNREASVTALKKDLGWEDLALRRQTRDCVMWYKIHFGLVHIMFPPGIHPKQRLHRHDNNLAYFQPSPRVNAYKFCFFIRTIPIWNALPNSIVTAQTVSTFQRLAQAHLANAVTP